MKKFIPVVFCAFVLSCAETPKESETPSSGEKSLSFNAFLDKFTEIPAFPFQFDTENLHTNAQPILEAEKLAYYSIDSVIEVDALHKFKTDKGWVCFSRWTEENLSHFEVSIFDEKGDLLDKKMAFPPIFSKNKYKMVQKIEAWENSIEFIYTESFAPDYTAIYNEKFEIAEVGFTRCPPIDFWKKLPRELWSDIQKHTLNDKGNYEVEEQNKTGWYQVADVIDHHIKTQVKLIDSSNFIYGISHSEQNDDDVVSSRFAFIQIKDFELIDVTDQLVGKNLTQALSRGMYEREYYQKTGFFRVICGNGNKYSYTRLEFDDNGFYIQSYGKDGQIGEPTLKAKWDGQQFESY